MQRDLPAGRGSSEISYVGVWRQTSMGGGGGWVGGERFGLVSFAPSPRPASFVFFAFLFAPPRPPSPPSISPIFSLFFFPPLSFCSPSFASKNFLHEVAPAAVHPSARPFAARFLFGRGRQKILSRRRLGRRPSSSRASSPLRVAVHRDVSNSRIPAVRLCRWSSRSRPAPSAASTAAVVPMPDYRHADPSPAGGSGRPCLSYPRLVRYRPAAINDRG